MRFAFIRRTTVENTVWVEAETELEAWNRLHRGEMPTAAGDNHAIREPVYRRRPDRDEFDL